jgi:NDP-sugar pyrophosphorylase family protein
MGALTDNCPKPMLSIHEGADGPVPILYPKLHQLRIAALRTGTTLDEIVLVVGYRREVIQSYFGDSFEGIPLRYVVQERLDGTAGAIALTREYITGAFMVMMGDDLYSSSDVERMMSLPWGVLAYQSTDAAAFGLIETDASGHVQRIIERPHGHTTGLVNTGVYMLQPSYFDLPMVAISDTEYGLPQTLMQLVGHVAIPLVITTTWHPIGKPEDLAGAYEFVLRTNPDENIS